MSPPHSVGNSTCRIQCKKLNSSTVLLDFCLHYFYFCRVFVCLFSEGVYWSRFRVCFSLSASRTPWQNPLVCWSCSLSPLARSCAGSLNFIHKCFQDLALYFNQPRLERQRNEQLLTQVVPLKQIGLLVWEKDHTSLSKWIAIRPQQQLILKVTTVV